MIANALYASVSCVLAILYHVDILEYSIFYYKIAIQKEEMYLFTF